MITKETFFDVAAAIAGKLGFSDRTECRFSSGSEEVRHMLPESERGPVKKITNLRPGIRAVWEPDAKYASHISCCIVDTGKRQCGGFLIYIKDGEIQSASLDNLSLDKPNATGRRELNEILRLLLETT